jgi:hypothetical protein
MPYLLAGKAFAPLPYEDTGPLPRPLILLMLVSAWANVGMGLLWMSIARFGLFLGIPMILLAASEIYLCLAQRYFGSFRIKLQAARAIAMSEMIVGLANGVSLICGLIIIIVAKRLSSRLVPRAWHDPHTRA